MIWLAGLGTLGAMLSAQAEQIRGPAGKLARYAVGGRHAVETTLRGPLRPGDPVLDEERHYVGRVIAIRGDRTAELARGEEGRALLEMDPEVELPAERAVLVPADRRAKGVGMMRLEHAILPARRREQL